MRKASQGYRIYSVDGVGATVTSNGGGLAGPGQTLILDDGLDNINVKGVINELNEEYNDKFNYVSLFSGIGGFEQGLDKLGGNCAMASEIDKFANKSYKALYGRETVGDITKVNSEDVPDHDLLVGGFPCQTFSLAGHRKGFDDIRGTLFFQMARIAKEKQPKVILAENVKGLVNHDKGRTLDVIVKTLNDIGYRVDFEVLNSKFFGVPQNRERIYIIGIREDLIKNEPWVIEGNTVVPKSKQRISKYEGIKTFNFNFPKQENTTAILRDILEPNVDEKYYISKDKTDKLIKQLEEQKMTTEGIDKDYPKMVGHADIKGHSILKRVYHTGSVGPTLNAMPGGNREPKIAEEQAKLNIVGHSGSGGQKGHIYDDKGLISCLTATDYKQPKQIATEIRPVLTPDRENKRQDGRRFKEDGEEAYTLTSQDRHGVALSEDNGKYRIRKLTPLECFRAQGFPDSVYKTLVDAGISNSQLYKQIGNAVTVNVIEAIGKELLPLLDLDSK